MQGVVSVTQRLDMFGYMMIFGYLFFDVGLCVRCGKIKKGANLAVLVFSFGMEVSGGGN